MTTRDVLTVEGPDAAAYLQGQLSQDVAALAIGESARSFVLAPDGKVDGWGRVRRTADDAFEIDVDPGAGGTWEARLRRFLLRTNATIALQATAVGAGEAGDSGEEAQRIHDGIPMWGREIDAATIPATLGQWVIDASVSFTKGCYTGQELVARIDSRGGHVPRTLVGLDVEGPPPVIGAAVVADGVEVAAVTSSAPWGEGSVALAFLPRSVEVGPDGLAVDVAGVPAIALRLPRS